MTMTTPTVPDEETPLLGGQRVSATGRITKSKPAAATLTDPSNRDPESKPNKKTSIPWPQFSILLLLQLVEPLTSQSIYPYAPELIRSLNVAKNDAEVGYYVGIIESLFYATEACAILHWSRLSDHIGRKPVILIGLFGLAISMYCFALSKTFWGLIISRALNGALNGNVGVIKTVMAEMIDPANLSLAFGYQSTAWSTGATLGPIIGGALSRPAERFPSLFGNNTFMKAYPYFLPCAVPATFTAGTWLVTFFFLKETHPSPTSVREFLCGDKKRVASEEDSLLTSEPAPQNDLEKPMPLRDLCLMRDVLIASINYTLFALVDISFRALQPLFLSTPVALGGLGLDPPAIGTVMSFFGVLSGTFMIFCFPRMTKYFGVKKVYMMGITAAVPCFGLFPVINYLARRSIERSGELGTEVWVAVGLQVAVSVLVSLCYGAVFIFVAAAAPNKASLGTTNGLAQLSVSIVRAVGPALANSLYSLSIDEDHHYMNGGLVYYVTLALSLGTIWVGMLLPKHPFKDTK